MDHYVDLNAGQVALAALLIVVNGAISLVLRLRMEGTLLLASVRTVLQLLLIGFLLEWVFRVDRWYVVLVILAVMTLIAGITAGQRNRRRFPGIWLNTIVSVWASSWLVTAYGLMVVIQQTASWYQPQYAIPLMGMILGNSLNGTSIGLNSFTETCLARREQIESALALGATRWEAARQPLQESVRTGMIPIVNAMMVVGIVSLPGMMTGQILSGAAPLGAVKYQIVIMFLIASATALCTVSVILLSFLRLFNARHQFLYHLISDR